jgi:hypothetical protein
LPAFLSGTNFEPEVILLALGWYLRFSLSYRDVKDLLAERGAHTDHVTVWRGVQRYAPEMERSWRSRLNSTNDRWRVDETYIRASGSIYTARWIPLGDHRFPSSGQRDCSMASNSIFVSVNLYAAPDTPESNYLPLQNLCFWGAWCMNAGY